MDVLLLKDWEVEIIADSLAESGDTGSFVYAANCASVAIELDRRGLPITFYRDDSDRYHPYRLLAS
jgi:hypothetical protein